VSNVIIFCHTPLGAGRGFGSDVLSLNLGASPKSAQTRFQQALRDLPPGHPFRFVCCAVAAIPFGQIVHPFPEFFALYVSGLLHQDFAIAAGANIDEHELVHEIVREHRANEQEQAEARIRETVEVYRRFAASLGFVRQFLDVLQQNREAYTKKLLTHQGMAGVLA